MTALKTRQAPKYRHLKPKDLGVVRSIGRDHYLGKYDLPESWQNYHQLISEWHANATRPRPVPAVGPVASAIATA